VDFDSVTRKFDPFRPSQAFPRSAGLPQKREIRPEIAAFSRVRYGLQTPNSLISGRQSPKVSGHIREYSRFAETVGGDLVRSLLPPDHGTLPRPILPPRLHGIRNRFCRATAPRQAHNLKVIGSNHIPNRSPRFLLPISDF
jgi:hypothetical protein